MVSLLLATVLSVGQARPSDALERVAMVLDASSVCSGFVVDATTVVTAGHCVSEGETYRIALHANTAAEVRFDATAWLSIDNMAADVAVLRVHGALPFDPFPIGTNPPPGTAVVALGYPGPIDAPGSRSRSPVELTQGTVIRGLTPSDYDTRKIVFDPTSGRIAPGSSGGPILGLQDGELALVGIVRGNVWREDQPDHKHGFGFSADRWEDAIRREIRGPTQAVPARRSQDPHLAVRPGSCMTADGERRVQLAAACREHASVRVEVGNLPVQGEYSVEVIDHETGAPLGSGTAELSGGPGITETMLSLGGLGVVAGTTTVDVVVRSVSNPSVKARLGPLDLRGSIMLADIDWEEDSLLLTVHAPLFAGDVELELRSGSEAPNEFWRLTFDEPRKQFRLTGVSVDDIPSEGLDLAMRSGERELVWANAVQRP